MHTDAGMLSAALRGATFAASFAALFIGHQLADHWVQTDGQAAAKGQPGWRGRWACTRHVATYTAVCAGALLGLDAVTGLPIHPAALALALAVSGVTHWLIDRRWLLVWLAERTGSRAFVRMGAPRAGHDDQPHLGTGAYALDQSAHYLWLGAAAAILAALA
jgi:hypothetical protein